MGDRDLFLPPEVRLTRDVLEVHLLHPGNLEFLLGIGQEMLIPVGCWFNPRSHIFEILNVSPECFEILPEGLKSPSSEMARIIRPRSVKTCPSFHLIDWTATFLGIESLQRTSRFCGIIHWLEDVTPPGYVVAELEERAIPLSACRAISSALRMALRSLDSLPANRQKISQLAGNKSAGALAGKILQEIAILKDEVEIAEEFLLSALQATFDALQIATDEGICKWVREHVYEPLCTQTLGKGSIPLCPRAPENICPHLRDRPPWMTTWEL